MERPICNPNGHGIEFLQLNTEIICVDTWLGSPEHWSRKSSDFYNSVQILNGMPRLYFTFLGNVVRAGVEDVITPFPMTSENAAEFFNKIDIKFDIVYVDAAHEYGPAKRDLSLLLRAPRSGWDCNSGRL